jgi:hypothetical protein
MVGRCRTGNRLYEKLEWNIPLYLFHTHIFVQVSHEDAAVERIRHSSSVHHFANQVAQTSPRNHSVSVCVSFGKVGIENFQRHAEVRLHFNVSDNKKERKRKRKT